MLVAIYVLRLNISHEALPEVRQEVFQVVALDAL